MTNEQIDSEIGRVVRQRIEVLERDAKRLDIE